MVDNKPKSFAVRRARVDDGKCLHQMIQELADCQNLSNRPKLTVEEIISDAGLDGGTELIHCYIVEEIALNSGANGTKPIGYALCYFFYATRTRRSYILENIYIKSEYRSNGIGRILSKEVAKSANTFGCKRIDFHVLGWSPARKFYHEIGAIDLTESEDYHLYRLDEVAIEKLINE